MASPAPGHFDRGSTPACDKAVSQSTSQLGYTDAQRQALLLDIQNSAQQVDTAFFLNTFLPPVDDVLVATVLETLKTSRVPSICKTGRLRGFAEDPVSQSTRNEAAVFRPLDAIINAIIKAGAICQKQPLLEYSSNPNMIPEYSLREASSRPDGGLSSLNSLLAWIHLACVAEYKKNMTEKEIKDNRMKIVGSLCQLLRDDARRRFCFGITVENTGMRFWYASRQRIVASEPFNFVLEHENLVRFFLSLAYAEEHQAGWDTSMTRISDDIFNIEVHTESGILLYRTEEILSNYSADALLGRGTRVWSARLLVDDEPSGEFVAIKDTWIDCDRQREGDIIGAIRSSMYANGMQDSFDSHFLTVLHAGDVYIRDSTEALHLDDSQFTLRGNRVPTDAPCLDLSTTPRLNRNAITAIGRDFHGETIGQDQDPKLRNDLVHHRTVFKEVCRPLYMSTSLSESFEALCEICSVLGNLHKVGWVHRDVSTANILIGTDGRAKLSDLEYAVPIEPTGRPHIIRTATELFMAVEVQKHAYLFYAQNIDETSTESHNEEDLARLEREYSRGGYQPTPPSSPSRSVSPPSSQQNNMANDDVRVVFQYNPLHDLESVFWIVLYFLFKREPTTLKINECKGLYSAGRTLFSNKQNTLQGHGNVLKAACTVLQPLTQPYGKRLDIWRRNLIALYKTLEDDPSTINIGYADSCPLRRRLISILHELKKASRKAGLMIKRWDETCESGTPATNQVNAAVVGTNNLQDADPPSNGKENEEPSAPPVDEAGERKPVAKRSRAQRDAGPPKKRQRVANQPTCDRVLRSRDRQGQVAR